MTPETRSTANRDERLLDIVEAYLAQLAAGAAESPEEVLARHPEFTTELTDFFRARDQVDGVLSPLREAIQVNPPNNGSPEFTATRELGDFRILRELGRGGMGIVYEAEQLSLGRRVALKVLPFAATMDPRHLQRFKNEAHAAAQLHHTNIVPVYYVGCERGVHYYAMQFIDGHSLADMISDLRGQADGGPTKPRPSPSPHTNVTPDTPAGQPITPVLLSSPLPETSAVAVRSTYRSTKDASYFRKIAELGIQAAEALDFAHEHGIIHRDVKPANLLVDADARLWVTDFGLAQIQGDARMTMTGDLVGTLRYMSPEQALAKRVVVDHRTDVYSLGATLYELLTLEPVFGGTDRQELLRLIAFEEPRPIRRLNKQIPAELETIVLKSLEKNPADRYSTAKELANDLRHWLEDKPIRARRTTLLQQARKWARRHRPVVWSAATILIVSSLVLSGTIGWEARDRAARQVVVKQAIDNALKETEHWQEQRRIPDALNAARRAEGIALTGPASDDLQRRVLERVSELKLLEQLENARLEVAAVQDQHVDWGRVDVAYEMILRKWGLDLERLSLEEATEIMRRSTVAIELAAVLDHWAIIHLAGCGEADPIWRKMLLLAQAADPHDWRNQVREALRQLDAKKLADLVKPAEVDRLLPPTLQAATWLIGQGSALSLVEPLLREAQRQRPTDYWTNHHLAEFLFARAQPPRVAEAIRFFTAALVLRPWSPGVHYNLGIVLKNNGQLDEALAEFREAVALNGDWAEARYMLGSVLKDKAQLDEAITEFREALRIKETYAEAHLRLGIALFLKGRLEESIAEYHQAIRFKKNDPLAHYNLGLALSKKSQLEQAIVEFRKALEIKKDFPEACLDLGVSLYALARRDEAIAQFHKALQLRPDYADAHFALGNALYENGQCDNAIAEFRKTIRIRKDDVGARVNLGNALVVKQLFEEAITEFQAALAINKNHFGALHNLGSTLCRIGRLDEGITEYRKALQINADSAEAHCNLGHALRTQGRFAEALASYKRGHELGSRNQRGASPSHEWVGQCERLLELDRKLSAILSGRQRPRDTTERIGFAELCQMPCKKLYLAAVRLYEEDFAAGPKPAGDHPGDARYNAACAAALAGCGQGADADQSDDKERARLRRQALDWLRTDLVGWRRLLEKEPGKARPFVLNTMQQWLADKDFARVRCLEALAKLPEAERREWQKLWTEVDELRQKVAKPAK
jgi:serine/threonine protein kinase/tetratricopeptide (TPR) repeat protein